MQEADEQSEGKKKKKKPERGAQEESWRGEGERESVRERWVSDYSVLSYFEGCNPASLIPIYFSHFRINLVDCMATSPKNGWLYIWCDIKLVALEA